MANSTDQQHLLLINRINDLEAENHRLKELNILFEQTNTAAKIGAWELDLVENKLFWSKVIREIYEVPNNYVPEIDTIIGFFKNENSNKEIKKALNDAIELQKPYSVELILHTFKGNDVWVLAQGTPVIKDGKVVKVNGTFQNINERKKQELALFDSENKYKSIIDNAIYPIFLAKPNGEILDANLAASELLNYSLEEFKTIGRNKIIDNKNPNLQNLLTTRATKGKAQAELNVIKKDGTIIPAIISSSIYLDSHGEKITSATIIDISERKKIEEELIISREEFLSAFDYSSIGMALVSSQWQWMKVNKSLCKTLGFTENELLALTFQDITHPDDLNLDLEFAEKLANREIENYQTEKRYFTKSCEIIWFKLSVSRAENIDGSLRHFISQIENINDKKIAQEALALSESRFRGIFNSGFQFIGFLNPDGTLIEANETALNFAGLQPNDVINKKFWDCYWWTINPETQRELEVNVSKAANGESMQYEVEVLGKNHTTLIILFSLKPLFDNQGNVFAILPEGRPIQDIYDARKSLILKNKELEQFAYGTSHDLKEPLRMIYSFMEILNRKYAHQLDDKAKEYINFAIDGAKRMSILIDELLNYARIGASQQDKENVNTHLILEDVINLQRSIIEKNNVKIVFSNLPTIKAVKTGIKLLFNNLIGNAIKYHKIGQELIINISALENNTHWIFAIEDNGIGIKKEYFSQIFEVFKRLHTQEEYRGTGLGLAACKKTVEQLNGEIWVESEEGIGSTFYFSIKK